MYKIEATKLEQLKQDCRNRVINELFGYLKKNYDNISDNALYAIAECVHDADGDIDVVKSVISDNITHFSGLESVIWRILDTAIIRYDMMGSALY